MSPKTVEKKTVIVADGTDAIYLSDADMKEINIVLSIVSKEWDVYQAMSFFVEHPDLYYDGKKWGFNDTEVRDSICEIIEKGVL